MKRVLVVFLLLLSIVFPLNVKVYAEEDYKKLEDLADRIVRIESWNETQSKKIEDLEQIMPNHVNYSVLEIDIKILKRQVGVLTTKIEVLEELVKELLKKDMK